MNAAMVFAFVVATLAAGMPAIPVWLLLLAVWVVVVLVGLAAWSLLRHRGKQHAGEGTR